MTEPATELELLRSQFELDQVEADRLAERLLEEAWPMYRPTRRDARPPRGPRSKTRWAALPETGHQLLTPLNQRAT